MTMNDLTCFGLLKLATKQIDMAQSVMSLNLAPHVLTPREHRGGVDVAYYGAEKSPISVHRLSYGVPVVVDVPPTNEFFLLQVTLSGTCVARSRRGTTTAGPGDVAVANPDQRVTKEWNAEAEQLMIKIDKREIQRHLVAEAESERVPPLAFEAAVVSGRDARAILGLVEVICGDLSSPTPLMRRPATARYFLNTLYSVLLNSMPNNGRGVLQGPISPAAPRYVRRAEEFIHCNIATDFGTAEIARSAGMSARSITKGFRRFREVTPMSYVRNLRLDLARRELLDADLAEKTVTSVALSCGIHHLSRFSQDYLARFGELPSATIRRSRSRSR